MPSMESSEIISNSINEITNINSKEIPFYYTPTRITQAYTYKYVCIRLR